MDTDREAFAAKVITELGRLLAATAARLAQIDPDFHSHNAAQLQRAARALGVVDRSLAETGGEG